MSIPIYDVDSPYETELYTYNDYAFIYDAVFGYEESGVEYGGNVPDQSIATSTLNDELNRLANGGTYRVVNEMVDKAKAAQQWAALRGTTLTVTDTVGVLNEIAQIPSRKNWLDFSGVCNYLAGTSGLPAAAALRQIED
jgi:hypothetical protein